MIPPQADAGFVAAMEDAREVYQRPHDPARPVVCLDETTKQPPKGRREPRVDDEIPEGFGGKLKP